MSSGAPEGLATPAPLVAPVVLLSYQSRGLVTIDVGRNRYRNGFVFMTVGRYPLSSLALSATLIYELWQKVYFKSFSYPCT